MFDEYPKLALSYFSVAEGYSGFLNDFASAAIIELGVSRAAISISNDK